MFISERKYEKIENIVQDMIFQPYDWYPTIENIEEILQNESFDKALPFLLWCLHVERDFSSEQLQVKKYIRKCIGDNTSILTDIADSDFTYCTENGKIVITGLKPDCEKDLYIDNEYMHGNKMMKVKSIAPRAFENAQIDSLYVPEDIALGRNCFKGIEDKVIN